MRVLVTGSRTWTDEALLRADLTYALEQAVLRGETLTVVHGACPDGADRMADRIATEIGATPDPHPADWDRYGKRAGYVRNAEMVALGADYCFAYIRDNSRGASMTVDLAVKAGIHTTVRRSPQA